MQKYVGLLLSLTSEERTVLRIFQTSQSQSPLLWWLCNLFQIHLYKIWQKAKTSQVLSFFSLCSSVMTVNHVLCIIWSKRKHLKVEQMLVMWYLGLIKHLLMRQVFPTLRSPTTTTLDIFCRSHLQRKQWTDGVKTFCASFMLSQIFRSFNNSFKEQEVWMCLPTVVLLTKVGIKK